MKNPPTRKVIAISKDAYEHLLKLRMARAKELNYRLVQLIDVASNVILNTPLPTNGNNVTPAPLQPDNISTPGRSGGSAPLHGDQS